MRKDAVVLEIRKNTAVVLASDGRFLRIRNKGYHVGQRIHEAEQTPLKIRPMFRKTLLIAACLVLALGSSAMAASKYMVWSYAGVDVGDLSVNYTLNFRNEVLSAEGNSAETELLIEFLGKIPYEPVGSAVERMMDAAGEMHTDESDEAEVVISVASFLGGTGRTEDRIMEGVDRAMEKARPDETEEERREEVRIERLEWKDAGQFMEDRHRPQSTPGPSGMEEAQNPEASPDPQAQEPEASEPDPQESRTDSPEAENPSGSKREPAKENPDLEGPDSESAPAFPDSSGQQPEDIPQEKSGQPFADISPENGRNGQAGSAANHPENEMNGPDGSADLQEDDEPGNQNRPQAGEPQSLQPQQAPGPENPGMNPGGQK